ncbi:MAG: TraX family protein [Lachnospiraceae bacterium]
MIAIITMTMNHVGNVFFPQYNIFQIIGRIAFPIFCFLLVEGFFHTHDIKKYLIRLGVFALISEIPFDLALRGTFIEFTHQNVLFTLFLGLLSLYILSRPYSPLRRIGGVIFLMVLAEVLRTDYGSTGILMILLFFTFREKLLWKVLSVTFVNIFLGRGIQSFGALALIPIALYNGEEGKKLQYFFYAYYPLHLLIIVAIKFLLTS